MVLRDGGLEALGRANRAQVFDLLLHNGSLKQADIARMSGLSSSTVSAIISDARRAGLIVDIDRASSAQQGRRGRLIGLDHGLGYVIGIEIGQSQTRIGVSDLEYTIISEVGVNRVVNSASEDAADAIAESAYRLLSELGIETNRVVGVGVGMPSPMDNDHRTIKGLHVFPGWTGGRLAAELGNRFGLPVYVDNDANAGALSEYRWGAGRGIDNFVYILADGGIGAGIVINGEVYRGSSSSAGEIAHTTVDQDGDLCWCGNRGCLQTVAGGDAIAEALRPFLGDKVTLSEILELADNGGRIASRVLNEAGSALGRVLVQIADLLNPRRFVIGGALVENSSILLDAATKEVAEGVIRAASSVEVVRAELLGKESLRAALGIVPVDLEALMESRRLA